MAKQSWQFDNNTLYGNFIKSGSSKVAVAVVLYKVNDSGVETQVDYTTTEKDGYWEFSINETNHYTIKFFGSGATSTDIINKIYLIYEQSSTNFDPLKYDANPSMSVTETTSKVDINRGEISVLSFNFSGISPTEGTLAKIEIYYRRTEEGGTYDHLKTIPIVDDSLDILTIKVNLELYAKPDYYDFQAIYLNNVSIPYKVDGSVFISEVLNLELNGVPDVYDYIEGIDLEAVNTDNPENGVIKDNIIKLRWCDLKSLQPSAFPIQSIDAFGRPYEITYEIASKIENYVIFIYVNKNNIEPLKKHPGMSALYGEVPFDASSWNFKNVAEGSDEVGRWVFGGEFSAPSCELTLPRDYYVAFWVGFRTRKTQSNVEVSPLVF